MKMNKKGSVEDIFLIAILLFLTAVVFIFVFVIQNKIDAALSPALESAANGSSIGITSVTAIFNSQLNYIFLAAFFGLLIATCITAFMTPTHPIFYVFSIIFFIGLMIVSVVLSNAWEVISTANSDLSSANTTLSIPAYVMANLPFISLIIGVVIAVILFSRANSGGTVQIQ